MGVLSILNILRKYAADIAFKCDRNTEIFLDKGWKSPLIINEVAEDLNLIESVPEYFELCKYRKYRSVTLRYEHADYEQWAKQQIIKHNIVVGQGGKRSRINPFTSFTKKITTMQASRDSDYLKGFRGKLKKYRGLEIADFSENFAESLDVPEQRKALSMFRPLMLKELSHLGFEADNFVGKRTIPYISKPLIRNWRVFIGATGLHQFGLDGIVYRFQFEFGLYKRGDKKPRYIEQLSEDEFCQFAIEDFFITTIYLFGYIYNNCYCFSNLQELEVCLLAYACMYRIIADEFEEQMVKAIEYLEQD